MDGMVPELPTRRMTADEFIAWSLEQPSGRYELEDGQVVAMASERARHARVKAAVWAALRDAIVGAGLPCEAFPDGMAVRMDDGTVFEPDALVRCGERLSGDAVVLDDPVIVVEVLSPSTASRDVAVKMMQYFRLPSLRHYIIIDPGKRLVLHQSRPEGATDVTTRFLQDGPLRLDPPGLELDVAALFAGA